MLSNIKLVRDQMQQFEDPDDIEYDGNDKELSDLLQIGENFVIPTTKGNVKGVDFYLFQCQQPKFWSMKPSIVFEVVSLMLVIM